MRRLLLICCVLFFGSPIATAELINVDSVSAGISGSPPNLLQSVSVGGYTANRSDLVVGTTEAMPGGTDGNGTFFGTWEPPYDPPAPSSNFDLHHFLGNHQNPNPIRVTSFGGAALWTDVNGNDPDFFLFEAAGGELGDTDVTIQAILPGDVLGAEVDLPGTGTWGDVGIEASNGNPVKGISFAVTDLLDVNGNALPGSAAIEGLQLNSLFLDPALVAAVGVPEPASSLLAAISLFALTVRRRR